MASSTASPGAKGDAPSPSPIPTGAKGGSPPPIPGVASPVVRCVARTAGGPMVLIGQALYDVTDAVHPRLLCQVSNTVAHLFTEDTFAYLRRITPEATEVVLHSIGSGNERVIAGWPLKMLDGPFGQLGAWTAEGNAASSAVQATDSAGSPTIQVWMMSEAGTVMLYAFNQPLTDCICRFGVPSPTLAFSADGQYLISGWPVGKGASPLRVYRRVDGSLVQTFELGDVEAIWSRTGHRLYLTGLAGTSRSWTPEEGFATLDGATAWPYAIGLSPDGTQVAYTAYVDPATQTGLRVYVYDIAAHTTRPLITSEMRSEVTFVKDGWVWYREEAPCKTADLGCGPWGTRTTGKVLAMELATGTELPVVFATGESPQELQSGWSPGQFWPAA